MKQKIFIIAGLGLLLVILFFIMKDLFITGSDNKPNPYEYDLGRLKKSDSLFVGWKELTHFTCSLEEIHGIDIDPAGRICVSGKGGVEIFDESGKIIQNFRVEGTARCIKTDTKGTIILGMEDHIELYDQNGKPLGKWKRESGNSIITGIAVLQEEVFVADAGEKTVYHYQKSGKLINRIGDKDPQNNIPGFFIPSPYFDLGIDPSGGLWIADPGRHTINKFSYNGKLISSWGKASMGVEGFCGCCNPSNFAFLSDGSFVTSEKSIERVKVYSSDGKYICLVATPGSFEEGTRGIDLAVDAKDRIFILDPVKKQVSIFVKK